MPSGARLAFVRPESLLDHNADSLRRHCEFRQQVPLQILGIGLLLERVPHARQPGIALRSTHRQMAMRVRDANGSVLLRVALRSPRPAAEETRELIDRDRKIGWMQRANPPRLWQRIHRGIEGLNKLTKSRFAATGPKGRIPIAVRHRTRLTFQIATSPLAGTDATRVST